MALSTTQYGYIIDPMVPFTDGKGNTIKDGFVRVFVAGSSTPVVTYRNFDGAANQDLIELDNSGRTKTSVIGSKGITYKVCVYDQLHSQESPILTVDKVSVIGANITAGAGATVVTGLDGLTTKPDGFVDASVVGTDGYVALDHTLVTDDLNTDAKVTAVENDRYIPLLNDDVNDPDSKITLGRLWQWVLGKINSLSTTITAFRTGDVIPVDGPSGTAKMSKDDLLRLTAENTSGLIKKQILTTRCSYETFNTGFYLIGDFLAGNIVVKVPPNYAYRGNFKVQVNYFDGTTEIFNLGGLWGDTSEKTATFTLAKDGDIFIYSDYAEIAGQLDFSIGYDTDLERRIKANETAISEIAPALSAEISRSKSEDFYDWVESEELESVSNVASYKVYYNSQYMLAAFRATGGITSYAFNVENGKRYRIKRCYGTGAEDTPFAVLCNAEIPDTSSTATFYNDYGDNPGGTYVELDDVDIVPDHDGVLYVMTLTTWGGASVFELEEQSVKQKVRLIDSELPKNNQWYGKKIGIIGTSVAYGSGATKAYAKTASDRLGFTIVPAVAPGLAIHIDEVVGGVPKPLTYGSLTMSNSEYVSAKAASLTDITISGSPKPNSSSWTPGSASDFNNYWRCWDNVFCADNADVELWIFSTVPNNTNFANTDWDAFDKSNWRYNDDSDFAEHRTTFLGAMLYLMDKMYSINNKAKMALCLDSEFNYWTGGKAAFAKLHEQYAIPVIDLYGKITKTPQMYSAFRTGDAHPSTFGQEQLGNMFTNELLLLP